MTDKKKSVIVISEEAASDQLELLLEYYDIDKNDIEIEQGPEALQTLMNGLVRAISKGRLEISLGAEGKLVVVQHLKYAPGDATTIEYCIVGQKAKMAMDRVKASREQERKCAFMSSLAGLPAGGVDKLVSVDMGTMDRLATLFSMV